MPPAGLQSCPATEYDVKIEGAQVRGVEASKTAKDWEVLLLPALARV